MCFLRLSKLEVFFASVLSSNPFVAGVFFAPVLAPGCFFRRCVFCVGHRPLTLHQHLLRESPGCFFPPPCLPSLSLCVRSCLPSCWSQCPSYLLVSSLVLPSSCSVLPLSPFLLVIALSSFSLLASLFVGHWSPVLSPFLLVTVSVSFCLPSCLPLSPVLSPFLFVIVSVLSPLFFLVSPFLIPFLLIIVSVLFPFCLPSCLRSLLVFFLVDVSKSWLGNVSLLSQLFGVYGGVIFCRFTDSWAQDIVTDMDTDRDIDTNTEKNNKQKSAELHAHTFTVTQKEPYARK